MAFKKPDKDRHKDEHPEAYHSAMQLYINTLYNHDEVTATVFTFRTEADYLTHFTAESKEDMQPPINQREFTFSVKNDFDSKLDKITPSEVMKLIKESEKDTFFADALEA